MTTILDTAAAVAADGTTEGLTPRWRATLTAFYGLPLADEDVAELRASTRRTADSARAFEGKHLRELWVRVGRRGRKSATAALIAVHEALFGGHEPYLLPGERGLVALVSKDTAGAEVLAGFCERWAGALGVRTNWTSIGSLRVLEIEGSQIAIVVLPCNAKAPRGFAFPVVICDEIALWSADSESAQVDVEVLAALRPAMAQFPRSRLIAISSPFGVDGEHYRAIESALGDDAPAGILAVEGPTWLWNPSITEQRTRELMPDERRWSREFAAVPGETESSAFDLEDIESIFDAPTGRVLRNVWDSAKPPKGAILLLDASNARRDEYAYAVAAPTSDGEIQLLEIGGITPTEAKLRGWGASGCAAEIARRVAHYRVTRAFGDSYGGDGVVNALAASGISLEQQAWTDTRKAEAVVTLRAMMKTKKLRAPKDDKLRSQLVNLRERLQPSGKVLYRTNGQDRAALLLALAIAVNDGRVRCEAVTDRLAGHRANLRKIAENPQRASNRQCLLAGVAPVAVSRGPRACKNCRRYTHTGNCCDRPSF